MKIPTYDLAICEGDEILYYLKWIPKFGFIPMSVENYERRNLK